MLGLLEPRSDWLGLGLHQMDRPIRVVVHCSSVSIQYIDGQLIGFPCNGGGN